MPKIIGLILAGLILSIGLCGCETTTRAQPSPTATLQQLRATPASASANPTNVPCITATPVAKSETSSSGVGPAAQTTPSAAQSTLFPQQLATREAIVERTGKPGATIPSSSNNSSPAPICPTTTPIK